MLELEEMEALVTLKESDSIGGIGSHDGLIGCAIV